MPKERLPFVIPIGGGSAVTRDGRLVTGAQRPGRALGISDGRVMQPGRPAAAYVGAAACRRQNAVGGQVPIIAPVSPLASDAAAYLLWTAYEENYDDLDLWAIFVNGDGNRVGIVSYFKPYYPSKAQWAGWLNRDDQTGKNAITDTDDVPFAFNERLWIRYDNLPTDVAQIYIFVAFYWSSGLQPPYRLKDARDVAFVIRDGRTIKLIAGTLAGYTPETDVPATIYMILGYFNTATRTWVTEVDATDALIIGDRWPPV